MPLPPTPEIRELLELLNSWRIPNNTRATVDELADWAAGDDWRSHFAILPRPESLAELTDTRDALREAVSGRGTEALNRLLAEFPPELSVNEDGALVSRPSSPDRGESVVAWLIVSLAADGLLSRLRTCPDCGWAFYDTSRNGKRVWCAMTAAEGGRGCGSIAKMRAYRARATSGPSARPVADDTLTVPPQSPEPQLAAAVPVRPGTGTPGAV